MSWFRGLMQNGILRIRNYIPMRIVLRRPLSFNASGAGADIKIEKEDK